eukprot:TRINITY_DN8086_c0_g1_i1.p1 TRINITY_DN8086_c0_g1~~TRINITY_DN8086_c0_g1_i1.p1  ORF type:complete len:535 (-),score=77.42 TRINITY_DN8086_c0_g1_i1:7-1611(-)
MNRVIAHFDIDCFFVQVERLKDPTLVGKPVAVQQHQDIICVSYEARALGIRKHDKPEAVRKSHPEVKLVHVPKDFGTKVTYSDYRHHSQIFFSALRHQVADAPIEKVSIDEAAVDLTEMVAQRIAAGADNGTVCGRVSYGAAPDVSPSLCVGSQVVSEIRAAVASASGLTCSAGVSNGKFLARLISKLHKPDGQTIIPECGIESLLSSTPVLQFPGIVSKLGKTGKTAFEALREVRVITDLRQYSASELRQLLSVSPESADWLFQICNGQDREPVVCKAAPKAISVSMTISPRSEEKEIIKVLEYLAPDLIFRATQDDAEHSREPKTLHVHVRVQNLSREFHGKVAANKLLKSCCTKEETGNAGSTTLTSSRRAKAVADSKLCPILIVQEATKIFQRIVQPLDVWSISWVGLFFHYEKTPAQFGLTRWLLAAKEDPTRDTPEEEPHFISALELLRNDSVVANRFVEDSDDFFAEACSRGKEDSQEIIEVDDAFDCPLCGWTCTDIQALEYHVQRCIDKDATPGLEGRKPSKRRR